VVVTSQAQEDAIRSLITPNYSSTAADATCGVGFWTGGRRAFSNCTDTWQWQPDAVTNLPITYFDWGVSQPDCGGTTEFCLHYWYKINFQWNDIGCGNSLCAACEYPGVF